MKLHPLSRNLRRNCFLIKLMQMNILIDCGLDTSYFLEFPPRDIIGSKAQQHASVSVEVSSNISDHSDHTSSSNDAISENKENDKKRRKLDHLIDSTGDGSGGAGGGVRRRGQFLVELLNLVASIGIYIIDFIFITNYNHMLALPYITEYTNFKGKIYATEPTVLFGRQMMKELVHFFGDSVLKSRTHSQPGFTNIFTGVTADWNVARSLYSIADIQSCIDKVRPVRFGEHLVRIVGYCNWMIDCGGEKCHHHPRYKINILCLLMRRYSIMLDVIILSDLRDKDGARFETILIEIGNCIGLLSQHLRAVRLRGIPFYAVSPHIFGEWMCTERQQKMYLPDNLMHHQDMIEQSLLYYASRADSSLQKKYQEPCVVFAGHPSLRSGAAINFIRKTVMTENLSSNIVLVNLGKDSLIASLNGTLNIHNTKTSLTSAENQLNQQRYVCGEFNVSKYGCRIDR
ncbi:hypothetical protein RhiirA4_456476 [Rhizophagus irregularis]|uniref:Beta-Casp domain-containing protein n=1 Tax=Rhizophagus irregularis TaxID=588596 RepID=A0A2I1G7M9_9GLOM|nr:hypothetical protein RhiirA4_456476 [Rhizophagus irregularis]